MNKTVPGSPKMKLFYALLASCVIMGCASSGASYSITVPDTRGMLETNNYAAAIAQIKKERDSDSRSAYGMKNTISFLMDCGLLAHYAGDYAASNTGLQEAERLIEEAFTKSISENFTALITSDVYKAEYAGEDFENIYVNIFSALNFYRMGDIDSAQVEIRKLNVKLPWIRDNYEAQKQRLLVKAGDRLLGEETYYTNSALARYLGMLFWRGQGNEDSARIEAQEISSAYTASPGIYSNPLPPELVMRNETCDELSVPDGMARLNLLCFTGLSPHKVAVNVNKSTYRGSQDVYNSVVLSPPTTGLAFRNSPVDRIEAVFDDGRTASLSLLENMGKVTGQVFETRAARIRIIKELAGKLETAAGLVSGGWFLQQFMLMGAMFFSEEKIDNILAKENRQIDVRMSQYLPHSAYVGGINLSPGIHSFTVNYYSGYSLVRSRRFEGIKAEAEQLNLVQDLWLQYEETLPPMTLAAKLPDFPGRLPAPTGLSVEVTYVGDYKISWNAVPDAIQYYIYTSPSLYNNSTIFSLDYVTSNTSHTIMSIGDLRPFFRVLAVGSDGFGIPSAEFRY